MQRKIGMQSMVNDALSIAQQQENQAAQ